MPVKIKAIAGMAVAAALSAGVVASAAVPGQKYIEFSENDSPEFRAAAELRESPGWWEAFEEALLEGKSPTDPVYASYRPETAVRSDDEILPIFLDTAPTVSDGSDLELVHDDRDGGYNLWSGRFVVDDVSGFTAAFLESDRMDCMVHNDASGELAYKVGYSVNYKSLYGKFTYLENGKRVVRRDFADGYKDILKIDSGYSGSGKLVEKAFFFNLHSGDASSALYDAAVIHVVDKDYAQTAEYAALPYGGIIDCYTYVKTSELPEAVSEEN